MIYMYEIVSLFTTYDFVKMMNDTIGFLILSGILGGAVDIEYTW